VHCGPSVIPDVGADLLAMCQRNITLNGHLAAAGGKTQPSTKKFLCQAALEVVDRRWALLLPFVPGERREK
jgi:hypothetical protein